MLFRSVVGLRRPQSLLVELSGMDSSSLSEEGLEEGPVIESAIEPDIEDEPAVAGRRRIMIE